MNVAISVFQHLYNQICMYMYLVVYVADIIFLNFILLTSVSKLFKYDTCMHANNGGGTHILQNIIIK